MELAGFDDITDDMVLPGCTKTEQNVGKFAPKPGGKLKKPLSKKAKPSNAPNAIEVNLGEDANIAKSDDAAKITKLGDLTSELDAVSMKLTPVKGPSKLIGETEVLSGDSPEAISSTTIKPTFSLNDVASNTISSDHTVREPLVIAESSHVSAENEELSADVESFELEADPLCHSSAVTRKCDAYQSGSKCSETDTSLQHDSDNIHQDLDLMVMSVSPSYLTVKQRDKLQPKSALCLKGAKNKSVSFSLPVETDKSPSHKQGLDTPDLNMMLEPVEDNLSNREDSSVHITKGHAEFPCNDEEFESIDEIMDIDSWDEPSIRTKLENDGADKTSGGSSKRNSIRRTFENDNHIKSDSVDVGDLNESNDDDDDWAPNDVNGTKKTTKRKRKSSKESDTKIPDNDEEFESIDEIMDIDSWDEPSIPRNLEKDGADKTSGGSSKRNDIGRTFENDNRINNDSGGMGDLNESKDNDNWTTNGTSDNKKTAKRKKKSSKESDFKKVKEPKKRVPHGTRRKRKQVDKTLLEKLENGIDPGIDPTRLPIRDLILIAGAKERISSKEAAISMPNSNNDSRADYDNPLDEGFDPDSEEAHRHRLKHAKKVNYQTHMKISRSRRWSKEDTELFYEAIREFKTNFGMMVWLFPDRTSRQLKAKFKAEERKHPLELRDALDFRSKDLTLFGKVIQTMKEQKIAEEAAANETEEEIGEHEKAEKAGTKSNNNNSENTDPWNDGDYDFNESADWELDADVSLTQNREERIDSEKEKQEAGKCGDEVGNSEKKDLWDDDFELLGLDECEDLEVEAGAASTQFDDKIDGKQ